MSILLHFGSNYEYILDTNNTYPLGTAFIDFIEYDFVNRDCLNPDVIDNPFLKLFNGYDDIMNNKQYIESIIEKYKYIAFYVLSLDQEIDQWKDLDNIKRFFLFQKYFDSSIVDIWIKTSFAGLPKNQINDVPLELRPSDYPTPEYLEILKNNVKDSNCSLEETYDVENLEQALHISFIRMVYSNIKIKHCKNCGKYFILEGRSDTEYCNRIAPNSNKTCSQIGSINKYHSKVKENPIMREFQKEYKKLNSRVKSKKISQQNFYIWSEKARELRNKAIKENMDVDIFIKLLGKLEV